IHNINHVIRDHSNRGTRFLGESISSDEQARHIWSVSTDAEINDDIAEQFPRTNPDSEYEVRLTEEGWVYPSDIGLDDGDTAENYCKELIEGGGDLGGAGGAGDSDDDDDSDESTGSFDAQAACSSSHVQGDSPDGVPQNADSLPGMDSSQVDAMREIVSKDIIDYAMRHPGKIPGGLHEVAEKNL